MVKLTFTGDFTIGDNLQSKGKSIFEQELEKQKGVLYGLILIVLGIACCALSASTGGSDVQDFVSGLLMGLSIVEMLAGIAVIGKKLLRG